jgi:hypothetical protein
MVPGTKIVYAAESSVFRWTAQPADVSRMKRLEIWILGIAFCAFGMAIPASAGTMGETLEPSTIAILTVVATFFGMWLRSRVSRKNK